MSNPPILRYTTTTAVWYLLFVIKYGETAIWKLYRHSSTYKIISRALRPNSSAYILQHHDRAKMENLHLLFYSCHHEISISSKNYDKNSTIIINTQQKSTRATIFVSFDVVRTWTHQRLIHLFVVNLQLIYNNRAFDIFDFLTFTCPLPQQNRTHLLWLAT